MAAVKIICIAAFNSMHRFREVIYGSFHKKRISPWQENIAIKSEFTLYFLLAEEIYKIKPVFIIPEYICAAFSFRTYVIC